MAFHHEATRSETLQRALRQSSRRQLEQLENFYRAIGSNDAKADAQICLSMLSELEQEAVLGSDECDRQKIDATVRRYVDLIVLAASPQKPADMN